MAVSLGSLENTGIKLGIRVKAVVGKFFRPLRRPYSPIKKNLRARQESKCIKLISYLVTTRNKIYVFSADARGV